MGFRTSVVAGGALAGGLLLGGCGNTVTPGAPAPTAAEASPHATGSAPESAQPRSASPETSVDDNQLATNFDNDTFDQLSDLAVCRVVSVQRVRQDRYSSANTVAVRVDQSVNRALLAKFNSDYDGPAHDRSVTAEVGGPITVEFSDPSSTTQPDLLGNGAIKHTGTDLLTTYKLLPWAYGPKGVHTATITSHDHVTTFDGSSQQEYDAKAPCGSFKYEVLGGGTLRILPGN